MPPTRAPSKRRGVGYVFLRSSPTCFCRRCATIFCCWHRDNVNCAVLPPRLLRIRAAALFRTVQARTPTSTYATCRARLPSRQQPPVTLIDRGYLALPRTAATTAAPAETSRVRARRAGEHLFEISRSGAACWTRKRRVLPRCGLLFLPPPLAALCAPWQRGWLLALPTYFSSCVATYHNSVCVLPHYSRSAPDHTAAHRARAGSLWRIAVFSTAAVCAIAYSFNRPSISRHARLRNTETCVIIFADTRMFRR